jgi:hypothetical protein
MRLITAFELATRNRTELEALFRQVAGEALRRDTAPQERLNALASLENIARALKFRP